jgi:AcrR family transcriptional regulator
MRALPSSIHLRLGRKIEQRWAQQKPDIQEASGFSRGNLYHHFKTKEEIVKIIIEQNLGSVCDLIERIIFNSSKQRVALTELIQKFTQLAEAVTKGPGKGMAFHVWSLAMVDSEIRQVMQIYFERIRTGLEKYILTLQENGKLTQSVKAQQSSVTLFGIVIPGFTVQSVYFDEMTIDSIQYTDSLKALFN